MNSTTDASFGVISLERYLESSRTPLMELSLLSILVGNTQAAFTCSKLIIETLEQGMKYVQN